MQAKFLPQFLSRCPALLEAFEKLVEHADDDGIDADVFDLGPFLELGAGFCADVKELGLGQFHASLASLLNINRVMVHVAQSVKDYPGQIALYAGFFGNGFAEIERKAQRHAWPVFRPPRPLAVHLARCCLFGSFLDCHWHPIPQPRRFFTALDHAKPIGSAIRKFPCDACANRKSGCFPLPTAKIRVKHDTTPQAAVAGLH
jgi:hypothetical protein